MSSETLRAMSARVREAGWDIRCILVMRRGRTVLEWYSGGVTREHNHNIFSITKTVVGSLAGAALDRRVMESPQTTLGSVFPGSKGLSSEPAKAGITLLDLMTMRSGFPVTRGNQPSGPERELFDRIQAAPDRLALMLDDLKLAGTPGEAFAYNNIDPALVLAMVEETTRKRALDFARETLFNPLEFKNVNWLFADRRGRVPGGYGLRLRALDLAKFGQLHLQNGVWQGRRLLSSAWTSRAVSDIHGDGYGCFWWITPGLHEARGVRGQRLGVHPEKQLVHVILADLPAAQIQAVTREIREKFILPSVVSDIALPENAAAFEALKKELRTASRHIPSGRDGLPSSRLPSL